MQNIFRTQALKHHSRGRPKPAETLPEPPAWTHWVTWLLVVAVAIATFAAVSAIGRP